MSGRRYEALVVLCVSGLLGFRVGYVEFPTWQVAVETSQVVAKLVHYPPQNPFYIYHVKLWTVIHQICAPLLRAGVSEIALSKALSGVLGAVSFQALSMLLYAFSPDPLLAVGAPFFIFYTRAAEHGAVYPITLLGTDHTYGVIGLSWAVLALGLLGAGCYRLGGFALAIAPAVHASWGAWLWLIALLAFLPDYRAFAGELRPALKGIAAGLALAIGSFLVQRLWIDHVPRIDSASYSRYLSGFITAWDGHRQPAPFVSVGMILNVDLLILTLIWLIAFGREVRAAQRFVLRAILAAAALSLCLLLVSWIPPDRVPIAILIAMPPRFLNFNTLAFVPLLLGLLGAYRRSAWSHLATFAFIFALFFSYRSMLWDGYQANGWLSRIIQFNPWHVFVTMSVALVAIASWNTWNMRRGGAEGTISRASLPALSRLPRTGSLVLLAAALVLTWRFSFPETFRDRTNDPFFAAIAEERHGLLLTEGSYHLTQLYTRRPILLDGGGLDSLPYSVEGAPEMERILREVYNINFFNPPPETDRGAAIPHGLTRPLWEHYSRLKWKEIEHDFGVTQVLTPAGWTLDLPVAAENDAFRLFRIPETLE